MKRYLIAIALLVAAAFGTYAIAQQGDTPEQERSMFLGFVEDQLSGPNRQIRISGIEGVLSSNARIGLITVADNEGIWLRITDASIVWSRSALIFSQRLQIDTLSSERIDVIRRPVPDESLPAPESTAFKLPELPIAVNLDALNAPFIGFGRDVFGLESELSVTGRIRLDGGALDTALDINRLDGPGGRFTLETTYANSTEQLELDLDLTEPENGVVANLLGIEGHPPVDLAIAGSGPLSELDVTLSLDADGERVLTGTTRLRRQADGLGYTAELGGPIAQLVPAQFRGFFGAETTLDIRGLVRDAGGMVLETLQIGSESLSLGASGETTTDGFLRRLVVEATVDNRSSEPVLLPVPGGDTKIGRADLSLAYGNSPGDEWTGNIEVQNLTTSQFTASRASFDLGGLARDIDRADSRSITFAVDGLLSGIVAVRADLDAALGNQIALDIDGSWNAGEAVKLANATLSGNGLDVSLSGDIADYAFDGNIGVRSQNVAPFSGLAGRDLQGALNLSATGTIRPISGAFDLTIDSAAQDLRLGIDAADNLLSGETTISGRIARGEEGLRAEALRVGNERIALNANGTLASGAADFTYDLVLADLALISPQAEGRLEANGRASGAEGIINLTTIARVPGGRVVGKRLTDAQLAFEGILQNGDLNGTIGGDAFLDGVRAQLAAGIAVEGDTRRLWDLDFSTRGARATGSLTQSAAGLIDGRIVIDAPDVSTTAALFLTEAVGAVGATVVLSSPEGRQDVNVEGTVRNLRMDGIVIGHADIRAAVEDLFKVPAINGTVKANTIAAGGVEITTLTATAQRSGDTTQFDAEAALGNGAVASANGSLAPESGGYRLTLQQASLGRGPVAARLAEPASMLVVGERVEIDGLTLDVAGGRITTRGSVAQAVDLDIRVVRLPLSIANLVRPDLGLGGMIDGEARVSGSRSQPDIRFDLRGDAITADALRQAGQSSLTVRATGNTTGQRLDLDARVTSPEGLSASARGGVPLGGSGQLALNVDLAAFPLGALNRVAPGHELGGSVTGTARVAGTLASPQATFDLRGAGIRASALQGAGIAALDATAAGSFAGDRVTLTSARVTGPQGMALNASGTVPLSGAGLSITLAGSAPLSLANRFLADRGTQVSGIVELNGSVSGSLQQPVIRGMFSTNGAEVVDPEANLRLRDINVLAGIDGDTVTLRSANASLSTGGMISASGTVSTNAAAGFPADLRIVLDKARYTDGQMVVATVNGNLSMTGPLLRDPVLAGEIDIDRAEITVPESLGAGVTSIDVIHRNPPQKVRETLERARANDGTPTPSSRPSVLRLNVGINAPARIFVRGRGLDAELGGRVQLTGPVTAIQPVGGFQLIRGRLSILGQRITFDEGTVSLVGDMDPYIDFIARSQGSDITVFITVRGRVSELSISFSSQPELPEDEVLARLIFNRGINELSPLQLAQLAAAAAELAGGSNTSLLGSLRGATGLDDLDVVTDSEGNAAVRAGRYIQDNIYLGVEAGAQGTTRGTINLDITQDLKARGSIGSDGDSSLGIFFERDY